MYDRIQMVQSGLRKGRLTGRRGVAALFFAQVLIAASWVFSPELLRVAGWFVPPLPADMLVRLNSSSAPVLLDRQGRPLYVFPDGEGQWRIPVTLDQVSPWAVEAILAAEDRRFFRHPGVDPLAVSRAAVQWLSRGRPVSGASTLTMQLVRRMENRRNRTLKEKLREAWIAMRLEQTLDKKTILEAYLNTAPFGGNVVGIEAAARRYFGHSARFLTLSEAALLAGLPQSPTRLNPLRNRAAAMARRDAILERIRRAGLITAAGLKEALGDPLAHLTCHDFPREAAHVAFRERETILRSGPLRVTLDLDIQRMTESVARAHVARLNHMADQAAVIVVEVPSGEIRAWVGSLDFHADAPGAQVDHARARRSPGSTLKPFVYGLAMEQNRIYPDEILLDDTLDFGAYRPGNFSGDYEGPVTVTDALRMSLNIPAVVTLKRLGSDNFRTWLMRAGVRDPNLIRETWGLGTTLGSVDVTLEELVSMYLALARMGRHEPPVLVCPSARHSRNLPLFRPDVCAMLWRMLEQPLPGSLPGSLEREVRRTPRICWKTGTSAGFRDAWTIGFNAHYLVGVWVGMDSGGRSPGLTGRAAALPILGAVFRRLPPGDTPDFPDLSPRLKTVDCCADSGLPATSRCQRVIRAVIPRGMTLERVCGLSHQAGTSPMLVRASSAADWDLARNPLFLARTAPRVTPRFERLRILEPASGSRFVMSDLEEGVRVRLVSSVEGIQPVFWYVDGRFAGRGAGGDAFFVELGPGAHQIAVMNQDGDTDLIGITVE